MRLRIRRIAAKTREKVSLGRVDIGKERRFCDGFFAYPPIELWASQALFAARCGVSRKKSNAEMRKIGAKARFELIVNTP